MGAFTVGRNLQRSCNCSPLWFVGSEWNERGVVGTVDINKAATLRSRPGEGSSAVARVELRLLGVCEVVTPLGKSTISIMCCSQTCRERNGMIPLGRSSRRIAGDPNSFCSIVMQVSHPFFHAGRSIRSPQNSVSWRQRSRQPRICSKLSSCHLLALHPKFRMAIRAAPPWERLVLRLVLSSV